MGRFQLCPAFFCVLIAAMLGFMLKAGVRMTVFTLGRLAEAEALYPLSDMDSSGAVPVAGINFPELIVKRQRHVVLITPKGDAPLDAAWLEGWIAVNAEFLRKAFFDHGAILLRGFRVPEPSDFERVALAINPKLETVYLGTSPRSSVINTTYVHSAADFPAHRQVSSHLEMSFLEQPPRTQMFYAADVSGLSEGGEVPLVDFRATWDDVYSKNPDLVNKSMRHVRWYGDGKHPSLLDRLDTLRQKPWQEMFKTADRGEALLQCAQEGFDCEWSKAGSMKITSGQRFHRVHEVTGASVWFNHLNVLFADSFLYDYEVGALLWDSWYPLAIGWYFRTLYAALRLLLVQESELGSNTFYEDGSAIPLAEFEAWKAVMWKHTVLEPYQQHDIVILDNRRVAHGRMLFKGARRVLTAWSDIYPPQWVDEPAGSG